MTLGWLSSSLALLYAFERFIFYMRRAGSRNAEARAFLPRPQVCPSLKPAWESREASFRLRHCCLGPGTWTSRTLGRGGTAPCFRRAGPPPGLTCRRGWAQASGNGSGLTEVFYLCSLGQPGNSPPALREPGDGGPRWVRIEVPGNSDQRASAGKQLVPTVKELKD